MISVKLKFRPSPDKTKEGSLFFQITHGKIVRRIKTEYCIYPCEWNSLDGDIVQRSPISVNRDKYLTIVRDKIAVEKKKIEQAIRESECKYDGYHADDIIVRYKSALADEMSVFEYMKIQSERQKILGRQRTCETYRQTMNSFMKYRNGVDLYFDMLNADEVWKYECHMRANGLTRNTTSFYMRILRCIYNRAVEEGYAEQSFPFKNVYTGVDKTSKRAVTLKDIRRIKELELPVKSGLDYARDMFLFSFYMRGMSFVDIAYLKKQNLSKGYVSYVRRKTGQKLVVRWEKPMQQILDKYGDNPTPYLLPVITVQGDMERKQYLSRMRFINRKLKIVAQMAKIPVPLSMYVSRHSWASIAKSKNVPLSVISEAMGHDNEETTRIYISSIQTDLIDEANSMIMRGL